MKEEKKTSGNRCATLPRKEELYDLVKQCLIDIENEKSNKCEDGQSKPENEVTIEKLINRWIDENKANFSESTMSNYVYTINKFIKPVFGKLKPSEISESMFDEFKHKLYENASYSKANNVIYLYNCIIGIAKKKDEFAFDNEKTTKKCYYCKDDFKKLICTLMTDTNYFKVGILIFAMTGMTIQEICALQWKDVDLKKKQIRINKVFQRIRETSENSTTKTKIMLLECSERYIPIPANLVAFLRSNVKKGKKDCYVLTGTKNHMDLRTVQSRFKTIITVIGLSGSLTTLRNSFIIHALEAGADLKSLAEILGITLQVLVKEYEQYIKTDEDKKKAQMKIVATFME